MSKMRGYKVAPQTKQAIRTVAIAFRKALKLNDDDCIDWPKNLDKVSAILRIPYDIVDDHEMPLRVEAQYHPIQRLLEISSSVYDALCRNEGRANFTIAHECGHMVLHDSAALQRSTVHLRNHEIFEDSEWQADRFAAELLMPVALVKKCHSVTHLMLRSGASYTAANIRFKEINECC